MKVRRSVKEMKDADVQFISLVDRSASRMPFRILKREGDGMGIDLGRLFTSKKSEKAPVSISAIVVMAQKDEKVAESVRKAIEAAGFKTDKAQKNEDGSLTYAQGAMGENDVLVRLSDEVVAVVKGFQPGGEGDDVADFEDSAASNSFYQGVDSALDTLFSKICSALQGAEDEGTAATQVGSQIDGFKKYVVGLVKNLPTAAFKADFAVRGALAVAETTKKTGSGVTDIDELLKNPPAGASIAEPEWTNMGTFDKMTWLYASYNKANKDGAQASGADAAKKAEEEEKKKKEEEEAKKAEEAKKKAMPNLNGGGGDGSSNDYTAKFDQVLEALKGVGAQVTELTAKVAKVESAQETSAKSLDGVVKKNEELSKKLNSTVLAPPAPENFTASNMGSRTTTKKADNDPRTGCFDTAMLRRRGRQ